MEGRRARGRPRAIWMDEVEEKLKRNQKLKLKLSGGRWWKIVSDGMRKG